MTEYVVVLLIVLLSPFIFVAWIFAFEWAYRRMCKFWDEEPWRGGLQ